MYARLTAKYLPNFLVSCRLKNYKPILQKLLKEIIFTITSKRNIFFCYPKRKCPIRIYFIIYFFRCYQNGQNSLNDVINSLIFIHLLLNFQNYLFNVFYLITISIWEDRVYRQASTVTQMKKAMDYWSLPEIFTPLLYP